VILPIDKSELPDKVWAVDQPDLSLEYRYNWRRDLKSYREVCLRVHLWRTTLAPLIQADDVK
jgi:hypothetical protein